MKFEPNCQKVCLRHRLEVDNENMTRIWSMEENAKRNLEAIVGRFVAADAELKHLAKRLEEKASEGDRYIPEF